MISSNIALRRQSGKYQLMRHVKEEIKRRMENCSGQLARDLSSDALRGDNIVSMDETHSVRNEENGLSMGFRGEECMKNLDVTSRGEGMTVMMHISGGIRAQFETLVKMFRKRSSNYPIRCILDDIAGVCYRTGPKGWGSQSKMVEWATESRALQTLPDRQWRILYVSNCRSHAITHKLKQALDSRKTELRFLLANATDLLQPPDSFVFQNTKEAWSARWVKHKIQGLSDALQTEEKFMNGMLLNSKKPFFWNLPAMQFWMLMLCVMNQLPRTHETQPFVLVLLSSLTVCARCDRYFHIFKMSLVPTAVTLMG